MRNLENIFLENNFNMNEDTDDTESDSVNSSSSEGEFKIPSNENSSPQFSVDWNPQGPAGLQFMCLVPFYQEYQNEYAQTNHTGKVKISSLHRQQRMNEFRHGQTTGRNLLEEKRLRTAAMKNNYELVVQLLENGVDPCSKDSKNRTSLHLAASQGHAMTVKILLDKGADPNMKDVVGNTPLHLAACTCQVPVVTLLLKAGTNLKSVDNNGRTPLAMAKSRLKLLYENKSYTSDKLMNEVFEVSDMMKTYLNLSGLTEDAQQIGEICEKLKTVSTRDEVENITNLLSDFTNMTLHRREQPG